MEHIMYRNINKRNLSKIRRKIFKLGISEKLNKRYIKYRKPRYNNSTRDR